MKRLFFALWPDEKVRKQCATIIERLNDGRSRAVNPANLHVTLLFLGYIREEKLIKIKQEADLLVVPKIRVSFNQISFWKKTGILCLTATETNQELVLLADQLKGIAEKLSISLDGHPFYPHITLFRKVYGIGRYEFDIVDWQSSSFCLVESRTHLNQVEYRILERWDAR